ncbi:hypothetical protein O7606_15095 [Micromonospora sp. WMMD882]|uniref:hypothetical protein n=1 Tax=Micromonospora sp. WMMD882 TaxID=3015151 RepID=UPI00248B64ED|nr:hypothetical protein [Micromonospora sp. WMMD882]WBB77609.1 hypothetical protein O7606_15095 [Micromonospora sp. WMMD882]
MGAIYTSAAFREYARAQVAHADILLTKHAETALSLCRCGRLHPCDEHRHWLEMRTHFRQFLVDEQYSSEVQQPHPPNPTPNDPSTPDDLA